MYLLLHILYAFLTIPLPFFQAQIHKLHTITTSLILNGKHSRLKRNTLCTPVSSGGMGAPDIQAYYKATILDQAKLWWNPTQQTTWHQIEKVTLASQPKMVLSTPTIPWNALLP